MIRATAGAAIAAVALLSGLALTPTGSDWLAARGSPEALLASKFDAALADSDIAWSSPRRNIWLSSLEGAAEVVVKPVEIGQFITIGGPEGKSAALRVTELRQIDGEQFGLPGVRFQLVTGKSEAPGAAGTVRLLMSAEPAPSRTLGPAGAPDRVL